MQSGCTSQNYESHFWKNWSYALHIWVILCFESQNPLKFISEKQPIFLVSWSILLVTVGLVPKPKVKKTQSIFFIPWGEGACTTQLRCEVPYIFKLQGKGPLWDKINIYMSLLAIYPFQVLEFDLEIFNLAISSAPPFCKNLLPRILRIICSKKIAWMWIIQHFQ